MYCLFGTKPHSVFESCRSVGSHGKGHSPFDTECATIMEVLSYSTGNCTSKGAVLAFDQRRNLSIGGHMNINWVATCQTKEGGQYSKHMYTLERLSLKLKRSVVPPPSRFRVGVRKTTSASPTNRTSSGLFHRDPKTPAQQARLQIKHAHEKYICKNHTPGCPSFWIPPAPFG